MLGLGFTSGYAAQGGDIGSVLARILATRYEECKAVNLNYLPLNPLPGSADPLAGLTKEEVELGPERATAFATRGRGYAVMHATRPGTIGSEYFALSSRDWSVILLTQVFLVSCCTEFTRSSVSLVGRKVVRMDR